jgi:hypothetical protein
VWSSSPDHIYCHGKLFQNLVYSRMHAPQNSTGHNGVEANPLFSGNPTLLMNLVLSHFTNWAIETKNCMSLKRTLWDICTTEWWDWIPSRNKRCLFSKSSRPAPCHGAYLCTVITLPFTWLLPNTHFTVQWCDHPFLQSTNHFSVMFML